MPPFNATTSPSSPQSPKERLLAGAIDWLMRNGTGDFSLHALAKDLNTSARMLVYHFGSKDGLHAAILDEVAKRWMREVETFDGQAFVDQLRRFWTEQLATAQARSFHVLAFQFWANALGSQAPVDKAFVHTVSWGWSRVFARHFAACGLEEAPRSEEHTSEIQSHHYFA